MFDRRKGKRGGQVNRLNMECKAYSKVVAESGSRYDGSHGFRLADGSWGTFVTTAKLKSTEPLLQDDMKHSTWIHEQENPLPKP